MLDSECYSDDVVSRINISAFAIYLNMSNLYDCLLISTMSWCQYLYKLLLDSECYSDDVVSKINISAFAIYLNMSNLYDYLLINMMS
ncbi:hypothetical protein [Ehrlichia ruminantium]|uniref:hypothetical protein n=1 Tax=Ehrlichia ruminantium TaxID=779 RepID=UPI00130ECF77|nr:hypothetical protein [Ehrlichia ruminantium]